MIKKKCGNVTKNIVKGICNYKAIIGKRLTDIIFYI